MQIVSVGEWIHRTIRLKGRIRKRQYMNLGFKVKLIDSLKSRLSSFGLWRFLTLSSAPCTRSILEHLHEVGEVQ